MFVICDQNDVIQDIATEKKNLSRGYTFPDHKVYNNVNIGEGTIGDAFVDGKIYINIENLEERQLAAERSEMISKKARDIAIEKLKEEGKLPIDYEE